MFTYNKTIQNAIENMLQFTSQNVELHLDDNTQSNEIVRTKWPIYFNKLMHFVVLVGYYNE